MLKYKISATAIYLFVAKICSCIGSIDLLVNKIGLPSNLELTIFSDGNSNRNTNKDLHELVFHKMFSKSAASFINSNNFQRMNSNEMGKLRQRNVQLLYIFINKDAISFGRTFEKATTLIHDQVKPQSNLRVQEGKNIWKPIYVFIWPTNCRKSNEEEEILIEKNLAHSRNFTLKDDVYIVNVPCGKNTTVADVSIWEFYSIKNTPILRRFHFEKVKISTFNPWHILGNKISRRKNFCGVQISATASNENEYFQESKFDFSKGTSTFEGGTSVLRYWFLRDSLNFTEFAVADSWTSENENGKLTGGALLVVNGEVDISIAQSAITQTKQREIDFLQPTDESIIRAYFIQPPVSKFRDIFLAPFQVDLWIAMFFTWLLITFSLRMFAWIQNRYEDLNHNDSEIVTDSWIWAIGTACQQGWHIQPVSLSIRITFALGHLTGLVCFAAYSASIVSFLSLKAMPMKTFSDILNNSFRIFANENTTPIAYILPELKLQRNFPKDVLLNESLSIPKIMDTRSAVVAYPDVFAVEARVLNHKDHELCDKIDSVQINSIALRSAMIIRKMSPFKEFFNYQIMKMIEGGLNNRLMIMYNRGTEGNCLKITTGHKQALGINDVLTAGIILFTGYVLSLTILLFEILVAARDRILHPVIM